MDKFDADKFKGDFNHAVMELRRAGAGLEGLSPRQLYEYSTGSSVLWMWARPYDGSISIGLRNSGSAIVLEHTRGAKGQYVWHSYEYDDNLPKRGAARICLDAAVGVARDFMARR